MLCNICLQLFSDRVQSVEYGIVKPDFRKHHTSFQSVQKSANQNCYICRRICLSNQLQGFGSIAIIYQRTPDIFQLEIQPTGGDELRDRRLQFYMQPADELTFGLSIRSLSYFSTGSESALDLAKHWLTTCRSEHKCIHDTGNHDTARQWYPTRLLDLSSTKVHLIQTSQQRPTEPYATLSHCWGKQNIMVLTSENLEMFESGLSLVEFPATFREAIIVARRLEIRYLWIDCYCIVQSTKFGDSDADKILEIAQMKRVYANSILNIGATHATRPADGCFRSRDKRENKPQRLIWTRPDGSKKPTAFQIYSTSDTDEQLDSFYYQHELFTRAWVMQERYLCPRMLHFRKSQLYWECNEVGLICETMPWG